MKWKHLALARVSALVLVVGACATTAYGQGSSLFGGGSSGGSSRQSSTGRSLTTPGSFSGNTPGATGSTTSNNSLFNSSGGSSGSSGSSVASSGNAGVMVENVAVGASGAPLQRMDVLGRGGSAASLTGENIINPNQDIIGGQAATNRNQFANLFSQLGRQMNQGNFNESGQRAGRPPIRIPLRLGFVPKPISAPQFTARFENRITKLPGITTIGPIQVTMEGSVAVLRGVVASEQDRQLAAGVALLEPEVESVRNELTVSGVETAPIEISPSSAP